MWTQLAEDEEVFSRAPYIQLVKRDYLVPGNPQRQDYYLLDYNDWVNIVALTNDFKLLLVKQFRPGQNNLVIGLPAGNVDDDEQSIAIAATRELLEETAYQTQIPLISLFSQSPNNATHLNKVHTFLAVDVKPVNTPIDSEIVEVITLDFAEGYKKLMNNLFDEDFQVLHTASILFAVNYILMSENPILLRHKLYLKKELNLLHNN